MMRKKSLGLMILLGMAAVVGIIWLVMMDMGKQESSPDGTFVKMMQNMGGMLS